MQINNIGDAAMTVYSIELDDDMDGQLALTSPALPLTIKPNNSISLKVQFTPTIRDTIYSHIIINSYAYNAKRKLIDIDIKNIRIIFGVYNIMEEGILRFDSKVLNAQISLTKEETLILCEIDEHINIRPDKYYINIAVFVFDELVDYIPNAKSFFIENSDYFKTGKSIENDSLSKVFYRHKWIIND